MIRSFVRAAMVGAVAFGAMAVTQAASATAFVFDLGKNRAEASSVGFTGVSKTDPTDTLGVKIAAYHANDINGSTNWDKVVGANAQAWSGYGLGVLSGNDNANNGTHQIDNVGNDGVDFVALVFDQAVTLTSFDRNVYKIGNSMPTSDAAFWAAGDSFTSSYIDESKFTTVSGGSYDNTALTNSSASSKVWLVSAAFTDRDDAFKLSKLVVNTPATSGAVPEPASWAMMLVGFGAIGGALRRRKGSALVVA